MVWHGWHRGKDVVVGMSGTFWGKIVRRLDRLDADSVQSMVQRLASEHGLLETVLRSLREGVVVLDGKGRVAYANRGACRLLGAEERDLEGSELGRWLPEVDWGRLLAAGGDEWKRMSSREVAAGWPVQRYLAMYVAPLDGEGSAERRRPGAVVILRDATGERQHTAERVESERLNAILMLAAGVAHEIGNPLNSMTIHLQLLAREVSRLPEGEERDALMESVEVARGEMGRLEQVLSQFLKAIRSGAPEFGKHDLRDIAGEALEPRRAELADRGIRVQVEEGEEAPPAAWVDKVQAGQACYNVMRNAMQAMGPGGTLRVSFPWTERTVGVAIQDTGPGIPPEQMGELFEPFRTTKENGNGLGLLIVQRIVRDHGGDVEVDSLPNGTRVRLNFRREDNRVQLLGSGARSQESGVRSEGDGVEVGEVAGGPPAAPGEEGGGDE